MAQYTDGTQEVSAIQLDQPRQFAKAIGETGDWWVTYPDGSGMLYADQAFRDKYSQVYPKLAGAEPVAVTGQMTA